MSKSGMKSDNQSEGSLCFLVYPRNLTSRNLFICVFEALMKNIRIRQGRSWEKHATARNGDACSDCNSHLKKNSFVKFNILLTMIMAFYLQPKRKIDNISLITFTRYGTQENAMN